MSLNILCSEFVEYVARSVAPILEINSLEDIRIVKSVVLHAILSELNSDRSNVPMVGGGPASSAQPFNNGIYPLEIVEIAAATAEATFFWPSFLDQPAPSAEPPAAPSAEPPAAHGHLRGIAGRAPMSPEEQLALVKEKEQLRQKRARPLIQIAELHKASTEMYDAWKRGDNMSIVSHFITAAELLNRVDTSEKAAFFLDFRQKLEQAAGLLVPLGEAAKDSWKIIGEKMLLSNARAYPGIKFKNEKANLQTLRDLYHAQITNKNRYAQSALVNYGKAAVTVAGTTVLGLPILTGSATMAAALGIVGTAASYAKKIPVLDSYLNPVFTAPDRFLQQARSAIRTHIPFSMRDKVVRLGKGAQERLGLTALEQQAEDEILKGIYGDMKELEEKRLYENDGSWFLPSRKTFLAHQMMLRAKTPFNDATLPNLDAEKRYNLDIYDKKEPKRIATILNRPVIAEVLLKTDYIPDRTVLEQEINTRAQRTKNDRAIWERLEKIRPVDWPSHAWKLADPNDPKKTIGDLKKSLDMVKGQVGIDVKLNNKVIQHIIRGDVNPLLLSLSPEIEVAAEKAINDATAAATKAEKLKAAAKAAPTNTDASNKARAAEAESKTLAMVAQMVSMGADTTIAFDAASASMAAVAAAEAAPSDETTKKAEAAKILATEKVNKALRGALEKILVFILIRYNQGAFIEEADEKALKQKFYILFHNKKRRLFFPDTFLEGLKQISLNCINKEDCEGRIDKFFEENQPAARVRVMNISFGSGLQYAWSWPLQHYEELKVAVIKDALAKDITSSALEKKWEELIKKYGSDSWDNEKFNNNNFNNESVNSNNVSGNGNNNNFNNESGNGNNSLPLVKSEQVQASSKNIRDRRALAAEARAAAARAAAASTGPVALKSAPKNGNNKSRKSSNNGNNNNSRKRKREERLAGLQRRSEHEAERSAREQKGGELGEGPSAAQNLAKVISALVYNSLKKVGYTHSVAKVSTLAVYTYLKVMEILFGRVGIEMKPNTIQYTLQNSTRRNKNLAKQTRKMLTIGGASNVILTALNSAIEGKKNTEIRNAVNKISGTQQKEAFEIADNISYIFDKFA